MSADLTVIDSAEPAPDVIKTLEDTLAIAREGRISAVAIAVVYRDGSTGDARSRLPSIGTMLGALAVLSHRVASLIADKD